MCVKLFFENMLAILLKTTKANDWSMVIYAFRYVNFQIEFKSICVASSCLINASLWPHSSNETSARTRPLFLKLLLLKQFSETFSLTFFFFIYFTFLRYSLVQCAKYPFHSEQEKKKKQPTNEWPKLKGEKKKKKTNAGGRLWNINSNKVHRQFQKKKRKKKTHFVCSGNYPILIRHLYMYVHHPQS